jgi:hypothetical protein
MRRLTTREVQVVRVSQQGAQGSKCDICQGPFGPEHKALDPVLDHDHSSGAIRGTLHRSCNALLGKLENNQARFGKIDLAAFLIGSNRYLLKHKTNITGLLHPTHKTQDEKRLAANAKRRKARATVKKVSA